MQISFRDNVPVGAGLVADVESRRIPEDGGVGIWWLGQASFIIRGGGVTVYIDPYLSHSSHRIVPPAMAPTDVTNAQFVLCTHDHGDHIDPFALKGIASASPSARFFVPGVARDKVSAFGIDLDRIVVPTVDKTVNCGVLKVTAIPAAHEDLDYSPASGYPYLGYIIELNGVKVYHSGDCTMYEGLTERLIDHRPDVVMLPINGHDWKRLHEGCIGNMTYREAADLAWKVGADLTIPMHYGMFAMNHEPPGNFINYVLEFYPEMKTKTMARYEGFVYLKA